MGCTNIAAQNRVLLSILNKLGDGLGDTVNISTDTANDDDVFSGFTSFSADLDEESGVLTDDA